MNDISKLIVGISAGCFIAFGLYYGVILKNEFEPGIESTMPTSSNMVADRNPTASADETVFNMIYSNPDASTFSYYSQKIDITKDFTGRDEFTVFVPSNDSLVKFDVSKKVPEDDIEKILQFLSSHIIKERVNTTDISVGETKEFKSVSGLQISLSRNADGVLSINGNKINAVENNGRDGIFYIIDFVIDKSSIQQVLPSPTVETKSEEEVNKLPASINN